MSARISWVGRVVGGRQISSVTAAPRQQLQFATRVPTVAPTHFLESRAALCRNFIAQRESTSSSDASVFLRSESAHRPALFRMPQPPQQQPSVVDVEELHRLAISEGHDTYIDPGTGLTVFTELAHRRRGRCCGSRCRHCPYNDWTAAPATATTTRSATTSANNRNDHGDGSGDDCECSATPPATTSLPDHLTCNGTPKAMLDGATTSRTQKKKNVPYTRTGDGGTSQLKTGERRSKDSAVFDAMGTVDELCSTVGLAHSFVVVASSGATDTTNGAAPASSDELDVAEFLVQVMSRLFDIGSHIAKPRKIRLRKAEDDDSDSDSQSGSEHEFVPDGVGGGFDAAHVDELEGWIDAMTEQLPELRSFILPTGTVASAQLHVCRCVCRRAERLVVSLVRDGVCDPNAVRYLNRLSDFLFVAARFVNVALERRDEILYKKPSTDARQRVAAARGNGLTVSPPDGTAR